MIVNIIEPKSVILLDTTVASLIQCCKNYCLKNVA